MAQQPPRNVFVYRAKQWQNVPASQLVPGDLVSIARERTEREVDAQG